MLGTEGKCERSKKTTVQWCWVRTRFCWEWFLSLLLVSRQGITVSAELAYHFCQAEEEALIHLQEDSEYNSERYYEETVEVLDRFIPRERESS